MNASLEKILIDQCNGWRAGAQEIRDECKSLFGRVTQDTEVGASTLEACAKRIETIVEEVEKIQTKDANVTTGPSLPLHR